MEPKIVDVQGPNMIPLDGEVTMSWSIEGNGSCELKWSQGTFWTDAIVTFDGERYWSSLVCDPSSRSSIRDRKN